MSFLPEPCVSEEEREPFCTKLERVRQIRNPALHRVNPSAYTTRRYGNDVLGVLKMVKRLGNEEFQESFNNAVSLKLNRLAEGEQKINKPCPS